MAHGSQHSLLGSITWFAIIGLAPACSDNRATILVGSQNAAVSVTHGGWSKAVALGDRSAVSGSGITARGATVSIAWNAMTATTGQVSGYWLYRATASGAEDFSSPITKLEVTARSYVDSAVTTGTTYFYVVRPVVDGSPVMTSGAPAEIRVDVPPSNMALVHRWMANQEMCALIGSASDATHDYRCPYAGPGNIGGYYDFQTSLWVDAYESGCNYSHAPACSDATNGCLGTGAPSGAVGTDGDIYFNRNANVCYIHSAGSWKSASDSSLTPSERAAMASSKPGLPPLVNISQNDAWTTCTADTKRLPSHSEQIAYSAWDASLSDAQVGSLSTPMSLPGGCNSVSGSGLTYDNLATPADPETLPNTAAAFAKQVRTGSQATAACMSRYGVQDAVGNVWQWANDQLTSCNSSSYTCQGRASLLDPQNTAWASIAFDGSSSPTGPAAFGIWALTARGATQFQPIQGLPLLPSAPSSLGPILLGTGAGSFDPAKLHSDEVVFYPAVAGGSLGAAGGGAYDVTSGAGRFALNIGAAPTSGNVYIGFRCVKTVP